MKGVHNQSACYNSGMLCGCLLYFISFLCSFIFGVNISFLFQQADDQKSKDEAEKTAKERESREVKLKQLVLKAKKEAAEYKSKVCRLVCCVIRLSLTLLFDSSLLL
jgi:hypothetical protein